MEKVRRWFRSFQSYDMKIISIKGTDNVIADAFSRLTMNIVPQDEEKQNDSETFSLLLFDQLDKVSPERWAILQSVHNETAGHSGVEVTFKRLHDAGHDWGPQMRQIVRKFVSKCACC